MQNISGAGYQKTTTDTSEITTRVISSGLTSGGKTNINATREVTITGSNVSSGDDLKIKTAKLTTNEATASDTYTSHTSSTQAAIYGNGGTQGGSFGFSGKTTTTDVNNSVTTAVVTTLNSGGNMTLDVTGGAIEHQGTQINSDGDFSQTANTIDMTAAKNTQSNSESTDTHGGSIEAGGYFDGKGTYDQFRNGQLPSASAPAAEIKAAGFQESSSSNESASQAVVTTIRARGNVSSTSTATTNMEGSEINAQKNVTIQAGELIIHRCTEQQCA